MYFVTASEGKTELFKVGYKVVPVVVKDDQFEIVEGEKNPLNTTLFEKYEHCFNFFNDFFANREHFFDKENGFGWDEEVFEGFDHFDVINVVFKPDEPTEEGTPVIVASEVVASVRTSDNYPFDSVETIKENTEEDCDCEIPMSDGEFCPECEIDKLKTRVGLLEKLVLTKDPEESEELIKRLVYFVNDPKNRGEK